MSVARVPADRDSTFRVSHSGNEPMLAGNTVHRWPNVGRPDASVRISRMSGDPTRRRVVSETRIPWGCVLPMSGTSAILLHRLLPSRHSDRSRETCNPRPCGSPVRTWPCPDQPRHKTSSQRIPSAAHRTSRSDRTRPQNRCPRRTIRHSPVPSESVGSPR